MHSTLLLETEKGARPHQEAHGHCWRGTASAAKVKCVIEQKTFISK